MLITPTNKNTVCAIIAAVDVLPPAETAMRVAAGAIAKKYLAEKFGIEIRGCLTPDGRHSAGNQRLVAG